MKKLKIFTFHLNFSTRLVAVFEQPEYWRVRKSRTVLHQTITKTCSNVTHRVTKHPPTHQSKLTVITLCNFILIHRTVINITMLINHHHYFCFKLNISKTRCFHTNEKFLIQMVPQVGTSLNHSYRHTFLGFVLSLLPIT